MRDHARTTDLATSFRDAFGQTETTHNPTTKEAQRDISHPWMNKNRFKPSTPKDYRSPETKTKVSYASFLRKYQNLSNHVDSFGTVDLMFYFSEKAKESGVKYVIANSAKDGAIFKKLLSRYTAREACLMIEFLFLSNQNYFQRENITPSILVSSWCNTLYKDSLLWVDDKYIPRTKNNNPSTIREWGTASEESFAKVGEW